MAISRSRSLSDQERKYQILKRQLFGKEVINESLTRFLSNNKVSSVKAAAQKKDSSIHYDSPKTEQPLVNQQHTFPLKNELIKITLLASLIILAQFGLYAAIHLKLINF